MPQFVIAVDQGTTSTRAVAYDNSGTPVAQSQRPHEQIFPHPGWVEHNPAEIWANTVAVLTEVESALQDNPSTGVPAAIGITNQRETVVLWNRVTGQPIGNAIVWQDTRTQDRIDHLEKSFGSDAARDITGLPLATYFSATKIAWLLDTHHEARAAAERGEICAGTIDSWLVWNLTGGPNGGQHITDVTNASRTLLMDIRTLEWRDDLCTLFDVPLAVLPRIVSSIDDFGRVAAGLPCEGAPITAVLGDQQAATFGQLALEPGECKTTYGTGNFLIVSTGTELVRSSHGLISTVGYRWGQQPVHYALEGSVAVTGSLFQWLRDGLGLFSTNDEGERLAGEVPDNGGVYIVPAFSGLFAPHWRADARGVITGLTRFVTKHHIIRAALESVAFQTADIITAAEADTSAPVEVMKVDGGMTVNRDLMQFQADILDREVVCANRHESTALGAAFAAGLGAGVWSTIDELRGLSVGDPELFSPSMTETERNELLRHWRKALDRSLGWVD
ncbi:MAG: Glycerol kinase [Actinomycetota bacterium]